MLYKKIHRQFLRDFRVGRKFKFNDSAGMNDSNVVYKIIKLYIGICTNIYIRILDSKHNNDYICVISSEKGNLEELWHEEFFEWLD